MIDKIKGFASWENITLASLYTLVPFLVLSFTDWRYALASLVVVNFVLYYFNRRNGGL